MTTPVQRLTLTMFEDLLNGHQGPRINQKLQKTFNAKLTQKKAALAEALCTMSVDLDTACPNPFLFTIKSLFQNIIKHPAFGSAEDIVNKGLGFLFGFQAQAVVNFVEAIKRKPDSIEEIDDRNNFSVKTKDKFLFEFHRGAEGKSYKATNPQDGAVEVNIAGDDINIKLDDGVSELEFKPTSPSNLTKGQITEINLGEENDVSPVTAASNADAGIEIRQNPDNDAQISPEEWNAMVASESKRYKPRT